MDSIIGSAIFALCCCLVFLLGKAFDRRLLLGFGLLFVAYLALDDVLTGLPYLLPATEVLPGYWNWNGKIFSLALSLLVLFALRIDRKAAGLTWRQKHPGVSLCALAVFVLMSFAIGFVFKPDAPDLETIAFQATMPGLAEELVYRGIGPALLLGLVGRKPAHEGMPWAVVFITGITFGLWHGIGFAHGHVSFDWMSAAVPMIGGVLYGWLRFYSGSVLLPIIGHGLGNNVFYLWRLF